MGRVTRAARCSIFLPVAALLVSCGGGDGGNNSSEAPSAQISAETESGAGPRMKIAAFVPPNPIPANANTNGMWSPVYPWPVISVHSALLPDGRVMTYGSNLTGLQTVMRTTTSGTAA